MIQHANNYIHLNTVGVVVIGRNEGERLRRCLQSLACKVEQLVYVDSGSTDNSLKIAGELGITVVNLDMNIPFTAARARNAGFDALMASNPNIEFVQFIDGDCELHSGWLEVAVDELEKRSEVAIVAGHLSEKDPSFSIYNRLAELEWNFFGVGEVNSVGGIFMIMRSAFDQVGGFDATVAAGEEPELCRRLRESGWHIIRIKSKMATHDLAMKHFSQWWTRQVRGGYGSMDVVVCFGLLEFKKNMYLARFWTIWLITIVTILFANVFFNLYPLVNLFGVFFASLWILQVGRIALREKLCGTKAMVSFAYAWFTMISFWPQMIGQVVYIFDANRKRGARLIEYKTGKRDGGV